jgi:uncharacterized membrane protein YraQ (UPF0718 family)
MKSSIKLNVIIGMIAFLITGLFSFVNNTWQLSLFRAGIGFLLFFILGNLLSFLLYQKLSKNESKNSQNKIVKVKDNQSTLLTENVEDIPLADPVDDLVDEPPFQAIPLQSLHNGEEASN